MTGLAAEMAFFGMLSVFPLTIAIAAGVGFLEPLIGTQGAQDVRNEIVAALSVGLPSQAQGVTAAIEDLFADTRPGVFTVGLVVAIWSASRGFRSTVRSVDAVYHLDQRRTYLELRLLSLAMALAAVPLAAIGLVAFAMGPLLGSGAQAAEVVGGARDYQSIWEVLRWPVAVIAATPRSHHGSAHRSRPTHTMEERPPRCIHNHRLVGTRHSRPADLRPVRRILQPVDRQPRRGPGGDDLVVPARPRPPHRSRAERGPGRAIGDDAHLTDGPRVRELRPPCPEHRRRRDPRPPGALASLRESLKQQQESYQLTVTMCAGTACRACGCLPVANAMAEQIDRHGLGDRVQLRLTGCHGFCEQGPLAIIDPAGIFYCHIREENVPEIVERTLESEEIIKELLYADPVSGKIIERESEIPFYRAQDRCLLADNRYLSPTSIEDYIAGRGLLGTGQGADGTRP